MKTNIITTILILISAAFIASSAFAWCNVDTMNHEEDGLHTTSRAMDHHAFDMATKDLRATLTANQEAMIKVTGGHDVAS